jgi:hypothetical protein
MNRAGSVFGRVLTALTVAGLFVVAIWGLQVGDFMLRPHWEDWINRVPFDSEKWKGTNGSQQRLNMVADLEARHPLNGKTEAEVLLLLGSPSDEWTGDRFPNAGCQKVWQYSMGSDRHSIGPAYAYFVVGFSDGKVVTTWRYSD